MKAMPMILVLLVLLPNRAFAEMPSVEDRLGMIDAVTSIAAGADRHDWNRVRQAFSGKVTLNYTSLWGGEAETKDAEEIIAQWSNFLPGFDRTLHLITNHTVTSFDQTSATMEADFQAAHRFGTDHWVLSGHYVYGLEKSNGRWRVNALTMDWTHETGDRGLVGHAAKRAEKSQ